MNLEVSYRQSWNFLTYGKSYLYFDMLNSYLPKIPQKNLYLEHNLVLTYLLDFIQYFFTHNVNYKTSLAAFYF